jgi:protein-tyrosine-phosphatase
MNTGRCLCGAITFEAEGEPEWVAHCHCESCRRQTGAALATFVGYTATKVTFTNGERQLHDSSPGVRRGFCGKCGSPLSYEADDYPNEIHLYLSSFDEPGRFTAQRHVFFDEHVTSFETYDNLPRRASGGNNPIAWGPAPTRNVLFLCTGNSARSILAEAIFNNVVQHGWRAFSAGSQPAGRVHDDALALLENNGFNTSVFSSKSWDSFEGEAFERVISLCDSLAAETQPAFKGPAAKHHWVIADPTTSAVTFQATYDELVERITELKSALLKG